MPVSGFRHHPGSSKVQAAEEPSEPCKRGVASERPDRMPPGNPMQDAVTPIALWRASRQFGIALVLSLAFFVSPLAAGAADAPLRIGVTFLPPGVMPAGDGFLDRIFDQMFSRSGLTYEFEELPLRRSHAAANNGLLDGIMTPQADLSGEFPNLIALEEPVMRMAFGGVILKQGISIRAPKDFDDYAVGYIRGWKEAEALFENHKNAEGVRNADILMRMLAEERIDVAFFSLAPGLYMANKLGMGEPTATEYRVESDLTLHLHRSHIEAVPLLLESLRAIKADGSYDEILSGYLFGRQ